MIGKIMCRYNETRHPTVFFALLLLYVTSLPPVLAGPIDEVVMGDAGSISQSGGNITINQTSQNMAIDWQGYNVNANDQVTLVNPKPV